MALSCYYSNWPAAIRPSQHEYISSSIPAASCYYFAQEEEEEEEETTKLPPELYNNLPLLQAAANPAYCYDVDNFFPSPDDMLSFPEEYCNSLQQQKQLPYNNTVSSTGYYYYSNDDQDQDIIHDEFQPAFHSMIKRPKHIINIDGGSQQQQLYCSDQLLTSLTDYELQLLLVGDNYNYNMPASASADDDVMMIPTLPDFSTGLPAYCSGIVSSGATTTTTETGAGGGGGGSSSPSAQSIAARHRRKKISDKTHELGKLIPGGQKMNTAEMFGAAHKYIKYLQAQVGILEFMASHHQSEEEEEEEEEEDQLHGLLESTLIQEKLYSTGKCMVPRKFVQELLHNPHHHHHVQIIKELGQAFD
ncbi:hypothetical protein OROMI_023819 [Orobanche minor]